MNGLLQQLDQGIQDLGVSINQGLGFVQGTTAAAARGGENIVGSTAGAVSQANRAARENPQGVQLILYGVGAYFLLKFLKKR